MQPLGDRVMIDIEKAETVTSTGIYIAQKEDDKLERAIVVALGEECAGKVKVDDQVVIKGYSYDTIKLDGVEYTFAKEEDIIAICKDTITTIA